ncbi:CRE-SCL-22 protein [Aphelenchoides avenae]|nr:CRE-SCL-22 protein [Aphelenchus avenae]
MAVTFNVIRWVVFVAVCQRATWAQITCPSAGSDTSASTRQSLLDTYNGLRKELASGKAANKTGLLPAGKNIYKMAYDCELEQYALRLLDCGSRTGGYVATSSSAITEAQMQSQFNATLMANWNLPKQHGVDSSLAHNENLVNWQYMAADVLTRLGCAVKMCPAKDGVYSALYLCITGGGWNVNRKTYVAGPACKTDAECTLYPKSVCLVADGLCQAQSSYPGKWSIYTFQFCRDSAADASTICAKGSPRMNDAARLLMLDHHNFARSNMVKGKEAISTAGALSPSGSNMYKMEWDCEAERRAQAQLDQYGGNSTSDEYRTYGLPILVAATAG